MNGSGIVEAFMAQALESPNRMALAITGPENPGPIETATFRELTQRALSYAAGLRREGFRAGDRVLLAANVSVDFYALALAVVGSRMSVVFIDGSMDRRRILSALRYARVRGVVGSADALRRWWLVPPLHDVRRYAPDSPPRGVRPLADLRGSAGQTELEPSPHDAPALVSFTSGSTGRAKGVVRTHGVLLGQHHALAHHLPPAPGDVDMPCFPAMVLHNLGLGVPTVLPPIDLRRPYACDPVVLVETARRERVTTLSGAPTYIDRVVAHMLVRGLRLPDVRRVIVGGAPAPRALCSRVIEAFPRVDTRVLYGATEAEPIAHISMSELLETEGDGLLVGAPVSEVDVVIAGLPERIEGTLDREELIAARAPVGEVLVRGAGVSRTYVGDPTAGSTNKVREPGGTVWHRTGDIAARDRQGRLWLLGRRGDAIHYRGRTLHPLPLEAAMEALCGVRRAALVAHTRAPQGELALVADDASAVARVRAHLGQRGLDGLPIRVVDDIPMDRRHASKVDRPELRSRLARQDVRPWFGDRAPQKSTIRPRATRRWNTDSVRPPRWSRVLRDLLAFAGRVAHLESEPPLE